MLRHRATSSASDSPRRPGWQDVPGPGPRGRVGGQTQRHAGPRGHDTGPRTARSASDAARPSSHPDAPAPPTAGDAKPGARIRGNPAHRDLEPHRLERRWERSCPIGGREGGRRWPWEARSPRGAICTGSPPLRAPPGSLTTQASPARPRPGRCSERRQQGEARRSSHGGRGSVYEPPAVGGDPAEALQNLTGPHSGSVTN